MEARSEKKEKLDDLPPSNSKYFTKYKADVIKTEMKEPEPCKHHFVYIKALEVECRNCHIGYYLNIGDKVKDGHIYRKDKLMI